jgi:hypothetical protein
MRCLVSLAVAFKMLLEPLRKTPEKIKAEKAYTIFPKRLI